MIDKDIEIKALRDKLKEIKALVECYCSECNPDKGESCSEYRDCSGIATIRTALGMKTEF